MEFLEIPLFDDDFYKMTFRLLLNVSFLWIIIEKLYRQTSKNNSYTFTYYMIGIIVFFLCFTLKKYELDIGMALGLFAIFGIIRYRTASIDIKEMTYLFIVIGISVINALANKKMSYAEIIAANMIVIFAIFIIERNLPKKINPEKSMKLNYDKINNLHFDDDTLLLADIKTRLGIEVIRYEVNKVDYAKGIVDMKIFYVPKK